MVTVAEQYQLQIGAPAPDFTRLPGVDGRQYSLADFGKSKALLVVFSCNHCPYVQAYESRMEAVYKDYKSKGLGMIAINSNDPKEYPEDSFEAMQARARDKGFTFPYVFDATQNVAESYGAVCTPHVFIFDKNRRLAYQGRYDGEKDNPSKGDAREVRAALDSILAGKTPSEPVTRAFGCSIKWGREHFARFRT